MEANGLYWEEFIFIYLFIAFFNPRYFGISILSKFDETFLRVRDI